MTHMLDDNNTFKLNFDDVRMGESDKPKTEEKPRNFDCPFCAYKPHISRSSLNVAKSARLVDYTEEYECGLGACSCPVVNILNQNIEMGKRIKVLEEKSKDTNIQHNITIPDITINA